MLRNKSSLVKIYICTHIPAQRVCEEVMDVCEKSVVPFRGVMGLSPFLASTIALIKGMVVGRCGGDYDKK